MNKKKLISMSLLCLTTSLLFTACGDGSEEETMQAQAQVQEAVTVTPEPLLSETERAICDYETKYNSGSFEAEDYRALADLYREVGEIRKQRDMLEASYRLYNDEEAFNKLQDIAVDLAEEDEAILSMAQTMLQNLELAEYLDESVNLISNDSWITTMMPKLYEGKRNYFLQQDGRAALTIQVGYDEKGAAYSNVWYLAGDNQVTQLQYKDDTVELLQTTLTEGTYDGAFEAWLVDGATGNVRHEQGTFAKGIYTGDYTAAIHLGEEAGDLFALWSNREGMEYTTFTGNFDEQGRTTVEQPTADNQEKLIEGTDKAGCVVYAYDENEKKCLFLGLEEGQEAAEYSFDLTAMGIEAYPAFTAYEIVADAEQNDMQIRIYDGEVQWFNGAAWISAGSVEQLALDDPFHAYAEKLQNASDVNGSGQGEEGTESDGDSNDNGDTENDSENPLGVGAIATPTPKPVSTPKPTQKPATPAATATPTPAPTPAPTQQPTNNTPASTPAPAPTPAPTPEPTPTPTPAPPADNGGSDTDIEWSPDIM